MRLLTPRAHCVTAHAHTFALRCVVATGCRLPAVTHTPGCVVGLPHTGLLGSFNVVRTLLPRYVTGCMPWFRWLPRGCGSYIPRLSMVACGLPLRFAVLRLRGSPLVLHTCHAVAAPRVAYTTLRFTRLPRAVARLPCGSTTFTFVYYVLHVAVHALPHVAAAGCGYGWFTAGCHCVRAAHATRTVLHRCVRCWHTARYGCTATHTRTAGSHACHGCRSCVCCRFTLPLPRSAHTFCAVGLVAPHVLPCYRAVLRLCGYLPPAFSAVLPVATHVHRLFITTVRRLHHTLLVTTGSHRLPTFYAHSRYRLLRFYLPGSGSAVLYRSYPRYVYVTTAATRLPGYTPTFVTTAVRCSGSLHSYVWFTYTHTFARLRWFFIYRLRSWLRLPAICCGSRTPFSVFARWFGWLRSRFRLHLRLDCCGLFCGSYCHVPYTHCRCRTFGCWLHYRGSVTYTHVYHTRCYTRTQDYTRSGYGCHGCLPHGYADYYFTLYILFVHAWFCVCVYGYHLPACPGYLWLLPLPDCLCRFFGLPFLPLPLPGSPTRTVHHYTTLLPVPRCHTRTVAFVAGYAHNARCGCTFTLRIACVTHARSFTHAHLLHTGCGRTTCRTFGFCRLLPRVYCTLRTFWLRGCRVLRYAAHLPFYHVPLYGLRVLQLLRVYPSTTVTRSVVVGSYLYIRLRFYVLRLRTVGSHFPFTVPYGCYTHRAVAVWILPFCLPRGCTRLHTRLRFTRTHLHTFTPHGSGCRLRLPHYAVLLRFWLGCRTLLLRFPARLFTGCYPVGSLAFLPHTRFLQLRVLPHYLVAHTVYYGCTYYLHWLWLHAHHLHATPFGSRDFAWIAYGLPALRTHTRSALRLPRVYAVRGSRYLRVTHAFMPVYTHAVLPGSLPAGSFTLPHVLHDSRAVLPACGWFVTHSWFGLLVLLPVPGYLPATTYAVTCPLVCATATCVYIRVYLVAVPPHLCGYPAHCVTRTAVTHHGSAFVHVGLPALVLRLPFCTDCWFAPDFTFGYVAAHAVGCGYIAFVTLPPRFAVVPALPPCIRVTVWFTRYARIQFCRTPFYAVTTHTTFGLRTRILPTFTTPLPTAYTYIHLDYWLLLVGSRRLVLILPRSVGYGYIAGSFTFALRTLWLHAHHLRSPLPPDSPRCCYIVCVTHTRLRLRCPGSAFCYRFTFGWIRIWLPRYRFPCTLQVTATPGSYVTVHLCSLVLRYLPVCLLVPVTVTITTPTPATASCPLRLHTVRTVHYTTHRTVRTIHHSSIHFYYRSHILPSHHGCYVRLYGSATVLQLLTVHCLVLCG